MIWGDSRTAALRSIVAPGDLAARMKRPHVQALAADMRELGNEPINLLTAKKVRAGWQLIAGRDRFAALSLNGVKKVTLRIIAEATPQELHDLEVSENLHRRVDNHDALVLERVRKVAARIVAERATSDTNVSKLGRPKSATGEAREVVAAQLGSTPGAVKEAVRREEKREEGATGVTRNGAAEPPPPIELFGNAMPEAVRDMVVPILAGLRKAEALLKAARAEVKALGGGVFDPGTINRLAEVITADLAELRAVMPTHLCPYCRGETVKCTPCKRLGAVTRAVFMSAPPEKRNGWTDDEQAAGLDAMPVTEKATALQRKLEDLKAQYREAPPFIVDAPAATPGEAIPPTAAELGIPIAQKSRAELLAQYPAKPKRGVRISVNGSAPMSPEEAEAFIDAQAGGGTG